MTFGQFINLVHKYASANIVVSFVQYHGLIKDGIYLRAFGEQDNLFTGAERLEMALRPFLEQLIPNINCLQLLKLRETYTQYNDGVYDIFACDLRKVYQMMFPEWVKEIDPFLLESVAGYVTNDEVIKAMASDFRDSLHIKDGFVCVTEWDTIVRVKTPALQKLFTDCLGEKFSGYIRQVLHARIDEMVRSIYRQNKETHIDVDVIASFLAIHVYDRVSSMS